MTVEELRLALEPYADDMIVVVGASEDEDISWWPVEVVSQLPAAEVDEGKFWPCGPECSNAPRREVVYIG